MNWGIFTSILKTHVLKLLQINVSLLLVNLLVQKRHKPMSPVREIPPLVAASAMISHVSLCQKKYRLITMCNIFSCSD